MTFFPTKRTKPGGGFEPATFTKVRARLKKRRGVGLLRAKCTCILAQPLDFATRAKSVKERQRKKGEREKGEINNDIFSKFPKGQSPAGDSNPRLAARKRALCQLSQSDLVVYLRKSELDFLERREGA
jgi:hypothetical protein